MSCTVKKKVREVPVPSRDVTTKLSLGGNNNVINKNYSCSGWVWLVTSRLETGNSSREPFFTVWSFKTCVRGIRIRIRDSPKSLNPADNNHEFYAVVSNLLPPPFSLQQEKKVPRVRDRIRKKPDSWIPTLTGVLPRLALDQKREMVHVSCRTRRRT